VNRVARSFFRIELRPSLAILGLSLMAGWALASCKNRIGTHMTTKPADTLQDIGKELGLQFPPGTRLLGVRREAGIDDWLGVKIELSAAEWPGFLACTPINPESFRAGERGFLGADSGFWDPHQAKKLRTAQAPMPNARAFNLGYDDSAATSVIVYIVNHGT
jgi:hypothetical protein